MIKRLVVENFQCLEGTYDFGKINFLMGKNGAGKTAISRAILFGYTGKDEHGNPSVDHLLKDPAKPMRVLIVNENDVELERRVYNGNKTIKANGKTFTATQFESSMPVHPQIFASIFKSGYFNQLPEAEMRSIFMAITPKVDKSAIFADMIGEHASKVSIDWEQPTKKLHAQWNKKRLEDEKLMNMANGELAKVNEMLSRIEIPEGYDETEYLKKCQRKGELAQEIASLNKERNAHAIWVERKKRVVEAETENEKIREENNANKNIKKIKQEKLTAADKLISELTAELKTLEIELNKISIPKSIPDGKCPTCEQDIAGSLSQGRNDEIKELEKKKSDLLANIGIKRSTLRDHDKEAMKLKADISNIRIKNARDVPPLGEEPNLPDQERIDVLTNDLSELEKEVSRLMQLNAEAKLQKSNKEKFTKEIDATTEKVERLQKDYEFSKIVEAALHPAKGIDARVIEEKMKSVSLEGFEFILRDFQKNGEPYDCFKIKYQGIMYQYCSEGEKIKASMKLAKLIDDLTGNKVNMMFVDNTELMDTNDFEDVSQIFVPVVKQEAESLVVHVQG